MPHHSQPEKALVSRHPHRPTNQRPQASSWLFVSWAQMPLASQLQLWARGCLLAVYPFHRHHLRRISCLSCLFWAAWPLFWLHTMMESLTSRSAGGQPGAVSRQYLKIEFLWRGSTIASAVRGVYKEHPARMAARSGGLSANLRAGMAIGCPSALARLLHNNQCLHARRDCQHTVCQNTVWRSGRSCLARLIHR